MNSYFYVKKCLILILLFVSMSNLFCQNQYVKNGFACYGTISGVTKYGIGDSIYNFTLNQVFGNIKSRGQDSYMAADILEGDLLFTTTCDAFQIKEVVSNNGFTVTGRIRNLDLDGLQPENFTIVAVIRQTANSQGFYSYSSPPMADGNGGKIQGIDLQTYECIKSHFRRLDSIAFNSLDIRPLNNTFTGKNIFKDSVFVEKGLVSGGKIETKGIDTKGSSNKEAYSIKGVSSTKDTVILTNNFIINGLFGEYRFDCSSQNLISFLPDVNSTLNWVVVCKKIDQSNNSLIIKDQSNNIIYETSSNLIITFKNINNQWKKVAASITTN